MVKPVLTSNCDRISPKSNAAHSTSFVPQTKLNIQNARFRRNLTAPCTFFFAITLLILFKYPPIWIERLSTRHNSGFDSFNWSRITPSNPPRWHTCYEELLCSRLLVPLDYNYPKDESAAIAIVKLSSTSSPLHLNDGQYRGPVIFNPGGPGTSGVNFIRNHGKRLRRILGDDFDFVGFDPRGIGFTTPGLFTFTTKAEAGAFYAQESKSANASEQALAELLARAKILGKIVEARARTVAEHMSTALVARDMLTIIDALGDGKLSYWGFSYGTVLGATFATMFPDKVHRMVLDGVVDAEDYYSGSWSNSLHDTDTALSNLYDACVRAGPLICPIYEEDVSLIWRRVDNLLGKIKHDPTPFFNASTEEYGLVDYSVVKFAILQCLVRLHEKGQSLVHALSALENGNAEPIWHLSGRAIGWKDYFSTDAALHFSVTDFAGGMELGSAVACSEADRVPDDVRLTRKYYAELANISSFAYEWTRRITCSGWRVRAKERYAGPFVAHTGFRTLFIGNTADPVTPLRNAKKMAGGFRNAVVLTQNSSGHTSFSASSVCTESAVRRYFSEGALPEPNTVCDVESRIFSTAAP